MSMKKSSDIIGNRTRDIPAFSAVPQTLRYRVSQVSLLDKVQVRWERHAGYDGSLLRLSLSPCLVIFSGFAQVVISLVLKEKKNV
jgi:hypothetical protein